MPQQPTATRTTFTRLLAEKPVLIADGGMGTSLFALGMEAGGCPELLNVDDPSLIRTAHKGFLDAGSDIVLTNTFGGTRRRLALHRLEDRVAELNLAATSLLRDLIDQYDRPIAMAGSVGPTGDLFAPLGPLDHDTAVAAFTEQIEALVEGGIDVIWIETISAKEELNAAYEAATAFDLPIVATMSFDTNGHTMMGFSPRQLADWSRGQDVSPAAVGANCGVGAGDVIVAVQELSQAQPNAAIVSKANCGLPAYTDGHLDYPHGPRHDGRLRRPGDAGRSTHHRGVLWFNPGTYRRHHRRGGPLQGGRHDLSRGDRPTTLAPTGAHGRGATTRPKTPQGFVAKRAVQAVTESTKGIVSVTTVRVVPSDVNTQFETRLSPLRLKEHEANVGTKPG